MCKRKLVYVKRFMFVHRVNSIGTFNSVPVEHVENNNN